MSVSAHTAGMIAGGSLVAIEVVSIAALSFCGNAFRAKFPRLAKHAAVGVKTTSYRFFAGLDTFAVSYFVTGNPWAASAVVGFELVSKFFLYFAHEWLWGIKFLRRFTNGAENVSAH